ncbi:tat pathway signal sequence [Apiospora rasikravindrae]|uniref:Tat pathway signal sequence n=1 Tax=Apiospora rasikravindrae TaxID=990691 RepID=A0ABR1SY47_9PEZI
MGIFTRDPSVRTVYGHTFKWTSKHTPAEDFHPLIYTYDKVGADALDSLDEIVPPVSLGFARKDIEETYEPKETEPQEKKRHRDLFKLVKEHGNSDEKLRKLWTEVNTVPEWVDWEQIERGQNVFWRYGGPSVTTLMFLSLLGGMGARRPVETLTRTGGFGANVVNRRLLETTQHTLGVHDGLEAIKPGGHGWESSVRVRLLHASVRKRIVQLAREQSGYYDVAAHGVPVNDLDCIGTINTFSATILWLGLPRQGICPRTQEIVDYLALWRWVAYLMGTPHDWLATPASAKAMMESLLVSEIAPSPKSSVLANNIITGFEGLGPTYASRGFMEAETYWLNGRQLAGELNIPRPSLYHTALVAGQCLFFMIMSYLCRSIPALDARHIKLARRGLYELLVHNKSKGGLGYKSKFAFKWIPDLVNVETPQGAPIPGRPKMSGALRHSGVERTALITLLFVGALFGSVAWLAVRAVAETDMLAKGLEHVHRIPYA